MRVRSSGPPLLRIRAYAKGVLERAGFTEAGAERRDVDAEVSANYRIPEALTVALVPDEHKEALRDALAKQRKRFIDGDVARLHLPMVLMTARNPR